MLARVVDEEFLEVVAGRGEDDLVTLEAAPVTGEGHVSEGLGVQQPLKHGEHVGLVLGQAAKTKQPMLKWQESDRDLITNIFHISRVHSANVITLLS